jgi:hypothetical protein
MRLAELTAVVLLHPFSLCTSFLSHLIYLMRSPHKQLNQGMLSSCCLR